MDQIDFVALWVSTALTITAVAGVEWLMRWRGIPLTPWFWTAFAIGLCAFAALQWSRLMPRLRHLAQGARGEREVGRHLERLRAAGYEVFHDLSADGFNVDHVLVGPGGIFAIETKTISKPART